MNKALINRSIKVTLIFMIIFFLLNYFTMKQPDIMSVVGRTLLATVAFFILLFSCLYHSKFSRTKMIYGTTIPIALIICILVGALFFTPQIGIISGLVIGIITGVIWELITRGNHGGK